jgi:uncharacterized membrane protein YhaH (DUF805 family)
MGGAMTSMSLYDAQPAKRPGMFSLRGRLGRARYLVYTLGSLAATFLCMLPAGYLLLWSGSTGRILYLVVSVVLFYGFLPFLFTVLTIRRAHDFGFGGWLALLLLVPVANLAFWFIPGTRGENRYGAQPEPPSAIVTLAAVLLPVLLIGAFLASEGQPYMPQNAAPTASPSPTSLRPYTP